MKKYTFTRLNQNGSSLLAALFIIFTVGIAGMSLVQRAVSEDRISVDNLQATQALSIGTAGLEYASRQISQGHDPTVADHAMGTGDFDVNINAAARQVTVVASAGSAVSTQSITRNFGADCINVNTSGITRAGGELKGLQIEKICNDTAMLTGVKLEWNWHACATGSSGDPQAAYEACLNAGQVDNGGAAVGFVGLANTKLYKPGYSLGAPLPMGTATSGVDINTIDYLATANGLYTFHYYDPNAMSGTGYDYGGFYINSWWRPNSLVKLTLKFGDSSEKVSYMRVL